MVANKERNINYIDDLNLEVQNCRYNEMKIYSHQVAFSMEVSINHRITYEIMGDYQTELT